MYIFIITICVCTLIFCILYHYSTRKNKRKRYNITKKNAKGGNVMQYKGRPIVYSAIDVAKYVILRCNTLNKSISNLKLQKVLYFLQAEFLVARNSPCFYEKIEAWDFGPVVPDIYFRYRVYGGATIPSFQEEYDSPFTKYDKPLADAIIDKCADYYDIHDILYNCRLDHDRDIVLQEIRRLPVFQ